MQLFKLTDEFRDLLDSAFDPETGEMLPAFEEKRELWQSKAGQVAAYILNLDANAAMVHAHIKDMEAKARALATRSDSLRRYLMDNMRATGITEIKSDDGLFSAKLYPQRDKSLELDEGIVWPLELCDDPKPPTPSKTKIGKAIEAGQPIMGARYVYRDRLTIR